MKSEHEVSLPEAEVEVSSEEICRKYRRMSRHRPPFCYEAETPEYSEADESRLYAMEKRCFDLNAYPAPSPELSEMYTMLRQRHADLEQSITNIKDLDGLHGLPDELTESISSVRDGLHLEAKRKNDPLQTSALFEIEKKNWEEHYKCKKLFFHQALSYLYLMEAYHPTETDQKSCRRFANEVETMFIGHQATTYSRSASHELGPIRRNKQPTIKHPYTVAVHGYNFLMEKIEQAQADGDEDLEAKLFYELKRGLLRDLFHDTLEDYYLTKSDLGCKLIEMLNFDLRIQTRMREADDKAKKIPENINFADKNRTSILTELWALKEEEEDKDAPPEAPYYLARKLHKIPKLRRPHVYLSKLRDRRNNLHSPKYKKKGKTLVKLNETLKIIKLGMDVIKEVASTRHASIITADDVRTQMLSLVNVCLTEIEKYQVTDEYTNLVSQTEDWRTYMEDTNRQFHGYKTSLAA